MRLRSNGFKDLDAPAASFGDNPNTGVDKTELIAKARINSAGSDLYTRAGIEVGYSHERSNETYLGLTTPTSETTPIAGTQGPDLSSILSDPSGGQRTSFCDVLRGAQDSTLLGQTLQVGTNDRTFYAQGIQSTGRWDLPNLGMFVQRLRFGFRWHNDQIIRLHTEDAYQMRSGASLPMHTRWWTGQFTTGFYASFRCTRWSRTSSTTSTSFRDAPMARPGRPRFF